MNPRYTALPILSLLLKIFGYVVLILGVLTAIWYFFKGGPYASMMQAGFWQGHIVPAFSAFFEALVRGVLLLGASELIHVFLDIEENTRRASEVASKSV